MTLVYENEECVMQELSDALVLELQNRVSPNIKVEGGYYGICCNWTILSYETPSIWKRIFCKHHLVTCYNIYNNPMWLFTINSDISKIVDDVVKKLNIEDRMATRITIRDSGVPFNINI